MRGHRPLNEFTGCFSAHPIKSTVHMTRERDQRSPHCAAATRRRHSLWLFLAVLFGHASCGYRVQSVARSLPMGIQSLGIPTFKNLTPEYKLEQRLSRAVLREFSVRTRIPTTSDTSGMDAVLLGEIRNMSSTPVTFGSSSTFGSAFLVTVQLGIKLVRLKDSAVLWEDDSFLFRERYVINNKVTDFFSEESPALDRLSQQFAASLVSTILNR